MTDFGAGPKLTQDLDWEVTTTGDIESVDGVDELQKDLALFSLINLEQFSGRRLRPRLKSRVVPQVNEILLNDPRIDEVFSVDVKFLQGEDELEIVADVLSNNEEQELVFNLE